MSSQLVTATHGIAEEDDQTMSNCEEHSSPTTLAAPLKLRVRNSRGIDRVVNIHERRVAIGSAENCSVRLDDATPVQCLIVNGLEGTIVRRWQGDVLLNDQPVQDAWLKEGDVLRVGQNELRLATDRPTRQSTDAEERVLTSLSETSNEARAIGKQRVTSILQSLRESRATLETYRNRTDELGEHIPELRSECEELNANVAQKDARINNLENQLEAEIESATRLKQQIEELTTHVQAITDEVSRTNENWLQQVHGFLERLGVPAEQWPTVASAAETPRHYLELIAKSLNKTSTGGTGDAQLLVALEARNAELEQRSQEIESQIREIEKQRAELQQIRDNLDRTRQELESAQAEFLKQKGSWEIEQHNLIAQFDSVRSAYEQERTLFDSEHQLESELVKQRDDLKQQLDEQQAVCNELRSQLEVLRSERNVDPCAAVSADFKAEADQDAKHLCASESPAAHADADEDSCSSNANETNEFHDRAVAEFDKNATDTDQHLTEETGLEQDASAGSRLLANADEIATHIQPETFEYGGSPESEEFEYEESLLVEEDLETAPQTQEELEFSAPSHEAPLDTASILAKYGVSLDDDDDLFAETDAVGDPSTMPLTAETMEEIKTALIETEIDSEGDESVEEYMAQLLSRVGGKSMQERSEKQQEDPKPVVQKKVETKELKPLRPEDYLPRSKAPVLDLTSMRSIANESARAAISSHMKKNSRKAAATQWFMAVCCMAAGGILSLWSGSFALLARTGAGLNFVVGIYLILRATDIVRPTRTIGQKLNGIKEKKQKKQREKGRKTLHKKNVADS